MCHITIVLLGSLVNVCASNSLSNFDGIPGKTSP